MQRLPEEIIGRIAPFLDRKSLAVLCCTNKYINKYIKTKVDLFLQWPSFGGISNATDTADMVHLVKSPDGTKLCIVTRRYRQPGTMCVFDIRMGQFVLLMLTIVLSLSFRQRVTWSLLVLQL